jgi:hypothetical protein
MFICFTGCEAAGPKQHIILNDPFEVHKAGAMVTTEVQVKEAHHYWFELQFWHKGKDEVEKARIKKLVGSGSINREGNPIDSGIPIPLKITISIIDESGEHVVTEKEVFVGMQMSGGGGHWDRGIGAILIPAGHCRITVESMRDIPELTDVKVILGIRYQQRSKY